MLSTDFTSPGFVKPRSSLKGEVREGVGTNKDFYS
jgi:hypothetical protein